MWKKYLHTNSRGDYEIYKSNRTKLKNAVKEAKQKSLEDFGNKMESQGQGNFKLLYRTLKNLEKEDNHSNTHKFSRNKERKILTGPEEIKKRWRQYLRKVLEGREYAGGINTDGEPNEEENIKYEEIVLALKRLKNDGSNRKY
ncbi:hypothetical protein ILUMI_14831 [Ignelater luminosus]|uniref:Uncharacterized protein n=1 Tax=Ignelater luminosus TaxID=2038154 RepID=A0A8K0G7E8_IGNLU|nr:hypothetical protein ILUMI_14831 [Ignelater luminosus]